MIKTNNLGGPYVGYSPQQTINNFKDAESSRIRRILRSGWNTAYATGTVNGKTRVITPFRAVNNSGDFLSRQNYVCGGANQVNSRPGMRGLSIGGILSHCDNSNIASGTGNGRFVADSSVYTTYRKQRAINSNYNDAANGGDDHNGSYVNVMAVRRF